MSLSSLIQQNHLPDIEAAQSLLARFLQKWRGAQTLEEKLSIESEVVVTLDNLLLGIEDVESVLAGAPPDQNNMADSYQTIDFYTRTNLARLKKITQQYLDYFNTERITLLDLTGRLRRISQKRSTLSLWGHTDAKYMLAESFNSLENLTSDYLHVPQATVELTQGALLLPTRRITNHQFQQVRIGTGSNGQPGNSDVEVQINNNRPEFMLNADPADWFEYERMEGGPCLLSIVLELPQEQIVNRISIEPINLGNGMEFQVEDIVFTAPSGAATHIQDLVGGTTPELFIVRPIGNDTFWQLSFIPTLAKTITIKFRQDHATTIQTLTADLRTVSRFRYAVAIKNLLVSKVEYESSGGISSKQLTVPAGLYAGFPVVDLWPSKALVDLDLVVSTDGAESWSDNLLRDGVLSPHTLLLPGRGGPFIWRLTLTRQDDAFAGLTSLTGNQPVPEVSMLLKSVSRFQSPVVINLPEKPNSNQIVAIQPKVFRRGDRYTGFKMGEGTGGRTSYKLPFNILEKNIQEDSVKVLVDNRLWSRTDLTADLTEGLWCYSDDHEEILVSEGVASGASVKIILDEERLLLEEREDGYYHTTQLPSDPDPNNVDIWVQPRAPIRKSFVLPPDQTVIKLGNTSLQSNQLRLVSTQGTVFTEVESRALMTTSVKYFVDYPNGILYLGGTLGDDVVRVTYTHQQSQVVAKQSIQHVFHSSDEWSIKIDKSALPSVERVDTIGATVGSHIDVLDGIHKSRTDVFGTLSTHAKTLSYDYVVKGSLKVSADLFGSSTVLPTEVLFIDGKTEFLHLIEMQDEQTVETVGTANKVSFTLSAGAALYADFGVTFSDATAFATLVGSAALANSIGKYFVDPTNGRVTVWVGPGGSLDGGVQMTYYYRDPAPDTGHRYSVDYKNGILYGGTALEEGAAITYKTIVGKIAYDIAQKIDDVVYDPQTNTVSVRTENLVETNSMIKIIWQKPTNSIAAEELRSFYSPTVNILGFRFN